MGYVEAQLDYMLYKLRHICSIYIPEYVSCSALLRASCGQCRRLRARNTSRRRYKLVMFIIQSSAECGGIRIKLWRECGPESRGSWADRLRGRHEQGDLDLRPREPVRNKAPNSTCKVQSQQQPTYYYTVYTHVCIYVLPQTRPVQSHTCVGLGRIWRQGVLKGG